MWAHRQGQCHPPRLPGDWLRPPPPVTGGCAPRERVAHLLSLTPRQAVHCMMPPSTRATTLQMLDFTENFLHWPCDPELFGDAPLCDHGADSTAVQPAALGAHVPSPPCGAGSTQLSPPAVCTVRAAETGHLGKLAAPHSDLFSCAGGPGGGGRPAAAAVTRALATHKKHQHPGCDFPFLFPNA